MEFVSQEMIGDYLAVGAAGFVVGVLAPIVFRAIGYVMDSVKVVLKGTY